jgi:hypothetical protein
VGRATSVEGGGGEIGIWEREPRGGYEEETEGRIVRVRIFFFIIYGGDEDVGWYGPHCIFRAGWGVLPCWSDGPRAGLVHRVRLARVDG